jgi:hypothetical protein
MIARSNVTHDCFSVILSAAKDLARKRADPGASAIVSKNREQKTGRGILQLTLGQGVTPCAHRAGDFSFSLISTAPTAPSFYRSETCNGLTILLVEAGSLHHE